MFFLDLDVTRYSYDKIPQLILDVNITCIFENVHKSMLDIRFKGNFYCRFLFKCEELICA